MQTSTEEAREPARSSETMLRLLIDSLPALVGYIGSDERYVFANRLYKELFGGRFFDLKGLHVSQAIGNETYQTKRPHIEAALRGERQTYEYEVRRLGGTRCIRAMYVPDVEKGKVNGIFVLGIDVTEQGRLEQELRSAKERLEYVVKSNPAVIWVGKPLPDLSDSYSTYQSKSTISMTGFESEELIGEKGAALWASRVYPDDLTAYRAATSDFWATGHGAYEYRFLHKDGTYRWIREEANVIRDTEGNVQDIIGYWTDITDRKRMEDELLRSSRLAAIGQTAAMIGHDLRNPLQATMIALHLLKKLVTSGTADDKKEAISLVEGLKEQVNYMNKIIADLQDYSGTVVVQPVELDLTNLINDALSTVKMPENIETKLVGGNHARVTTDPTLMKRIIVNLVSNAIQAMPNGGKLRVTLVDGPSAFSVAVEDTGVGITQDDLRQLFTPFFTKKAKGQGLGLAVCKRLAEAQGGKIIAESKLGQGSTFTVTIPLKVSVEVN